MPVKTSDLQRMAYGLFILAMVIAAMILGQFIFAPLIFATYLAIAFLPLLRSIQRLIGSDLWSIIILMLLIILVIGGIGTVVFFQFHKLSTDFGQLIDKIEMQWESLKVALADWMNIEIGDFEAMLTEWARSMVNYGSDVALFMVDNVTNLVTYLGLIPVYAFLILLYRKSIADQFNLLMSRFSFENPGFLGSISHLIQEYLKGTMIVMLIVGILNSTGLYILGVPYAIALGFGVAACAVVPYIGITAGGLVVMLISFATQGSWYILLLIVMVFALIQFLEGHFLTPAIVGNKLNINPLTAILALLVGGKIWGIAGMILAVPTAGILTLLLRKFREQEVRS